MATDENTIGIKAQLDISDLEMKKKVMAAIMKDFEAAEKRRQKEMAQAAKEEKKAIDEIIKANQKRAKEAEKAAKQQESANKKDQKSFLELAAKITAVVGTIIVAYKKLEEAAELRGMIMAGQNLAASYGMDLQSILSGLDEVSGGMLSLRDKMLVVNRSLIAGGAEFADKIPQLYKIAQAASIATGKDLNWIFETLNRGIAKGSPLLIDNAELYLRIGTAVDKYAASLGISADGLTAQQRQQATLNAVLEQGAALVETVGDDAINSVRGFKQLESSAVDLADTIGLIATNTQLATDAFGFLATGIDALSQTIVLAYAGLVKMQTLISQFQVAGLSKGLTGISGLMYGIVTTDIGKAMAAAQKAGELAISGALGLGRGTGKPLTAGMDVEAQYQAALKSQKEYSEKYHDLQIKTGESILDAENAFHEKSADAWHDYMKKTNDIVADGIKERAKIHQLFAEVEEAESDYQRGIEKASVSHNDKMADIERDYQDTIRNIQQTYQEDALDAIRNLDAIGLIRAKEKRDKDLAAARQDRDRSMSDEERDYQRGLSELIRALEDKKAEAEEARQRDLEEQRRNEQEKTQAAKDAYNQQIVDAQIAFNNKIASIRAQYTQEDAEAQAHYLNLENQLVAHLNAMAAIAARYNIGAGGGTTSPARTRRGEFRRAEGGIDVVSTPTQFLAGEAGPEIAAFIPLNRAIPTPTIQTVNHVGDFSHSIDAAITSSVAGIDGRIMAAVRKALGEVLR